MTITLIMSAYIEAYRLFGYLAYSTIHNSKAIAKSKLELIKLTKKSKDKPVKREQGKDLYVNLTNVQQVNLLNKKRSESSKMLVKFEESLKAYNSKSDVDPLFDQNNKNIDFNSIPSQLKAELAQMAFSFVNLLRLTKLEHGSKGIEYTVTANGINMPQWWIHTKMNNFSPKSLKHSLSLIKTSTTKGSDVHSSRFLANGSGALFPINMTAAYLIDAFKATGKVVEAKNTLLTKYMARLDAATKDGFNYVKTPAMSLLYAEGYYYCTNLQQLRMHMTIITLSGFGSPLTQSEFEFMRYHFWRYNHLTLKRKLLQ